MTLHRFLERSYEKYNRRELVDGDPLRFLYLYDSPGDREVAGLVAASLAFGRVEQIGRSVSAVLSALGPPAARVEEAAPGSLADLLRGFRHRFVRGEEVARMLEGAGRLRRAHGSLNRYFVDSCYKPAFAEGGDMRQAISRLVQALQTDGESGFLLPDPRRGSACKRLHLYLRWMVRRDDVDPGTWEGVRARDLMVPMDTHMHRVSTILGLTSRAQADGKAARAATDSFLRLRPEDPVRYDFALTRIGMQGRLDEIPPELRRGTLYTTA